MGARELNQFERDLGLGDFTGTIKVAAILWDKNGASVDYNCKTTKTKLRNAIAKPKRCSQETCINLVKSDNKDVLKALAYRCQQTYNKGLPILNKSACFIGVTK